jgi:hypothetical protein
MAGQRPFSTFGGESRDANKIQDNVDRVLAPIVEHPLLQGNVVGPAPVQGHPSGSALYHGLGHKVSGWICIDHQGFATGSANYGSTPTFWRVDQSYTNTSSYLILTASFDTTGSFYIF